MLEVGRRRRGGWEEAAEEARTEATDEPAKEASSKAGTKAQDKALQWLSNMGICIFKIQSQANRMRQKATKEKAKKVKNNIQQIGYIREVARSGKKVFSLEAHNRAEAK
jgi:hypothetical protein